MHLPEPRGPLSEVLIDVLTGGNAPPQDFESAALAFRSEQPLHDEDFQITLFILYELHYRGFVDAADEWEWSTCLLAGRAALEKTFEAALRAIAESTVPAVTTAQETAEALFAIAEGTDGPSVSKHLARKADLEQAREFLVHKSIYQLKEADPHTWAIPRLSGRAKSAIVEIQSDEYGGGAPGRMHSELFAVTMGGLGLKPEFGAYIEHIPAITLASVNAMSLFGLHRRLRGAILGHLAIYEMTSSIPNAVYARGFRRLGFDEPVTDYFDEHVEADAVHEQIAGRDLAGGFIEDEPELAADVFFGANTVVAIDALVSNHQLQCWEDGRTSLRTALHTDGAMAFR